MKSIVLMAIIGVASVATFYVKTTQAMNIELSSTQQQLVKSLYHIDAFKAGDFQLKSGQSSLFYVDLRSIISYPKILQSVGDELFKIANDGKYDHICGVPYTALPIATAIALKHNYPLVMTRKEAKGYGTKKMVEGVFKARQNCLVIEDVITTGSSVMQTIDLLEKEGLKVTDVAVCVDRQQGGKEAIEKKGYNVHALFTISQMLDVLFADGCINQQLYDTIKQSLNQKP